MADSIFKQNAFYAPCVGSMQVLFYVQKKNKGGDD